MTAAFACSPGGRCFNLVVAYAWGTALVKNGSSCLLPYLQFPIRECDHLLICRRALVFANFVGERHVLPSFAVIGLKMIPLTIPGAIYRVVWSNHDVT